jgi:hypothetical protein
MNKTTEEFGVVGNLVRASTIRTRENGKRLLGTQVTCVNNRVTSLDAKLAFLNIGSLAITKVRANGAHSVNLIVLEMLPTTGHITTGSTICTHGL